MPNSGVYSYQTDEYRNGAVALLLVGGIAAADYVVFSLDAFLRAVHYGPASRFANRRLRSVGARRGALLLEPRALLSQWSHYEIFVIRQGMNVDPVFALLTIARAAEADWNARQDLKWFQHTTVEGMISVFSASAPLRRGSDTCEQI